MSFSDSTEQSISEEALGDLTIDTIVSMYEKSQQQQPLEEPHVWLGNVWLGRAKAVHGVDIDDPKMHKVALYETYLCSCVEPPVCARALGLYFLFKEHPEIIEKHTKFAYNNAYYLIAEMKKGEAEHEH